jgi:hypothetical protein
VTEPQPEELESRPWWVRPLKVAGITVVALLVGAFWLANLLVIDPQPSGPQHTARRRCYEYYEKVLQWRRVRGEYPDSLAAMEVPLTPADREAFVRLEEDPWGHPYCLRRDGDDVVVFSRGPDGKERTWDDIEAGDTSWEGP